MKNLTWFEARALARLTRAVRREQWRKWLLWRSYVWMIHEVIEGVESLRVARAEDFGAGEFLAKDWTDEVRTDGSRPPCTAADEVALPGRLGAGLGAWSLDPTRCAGAGNGGDPLAPQVGEDGTEYVYFDFAVLEDAVAGSYGVALADAGTLEVSPGVGGHLDGTSITIEWIPGVFEGARYVLDAWGGDVPGADNPKTFTLDADKEIDPVLVRLWPMTVALTPDFDLYSYGNISFDPAPDYTDGEGLQYWVAGTVVSVIYTPNVPLTGSPPGSGSSVQYYVAGDGALNEVPISPSAGDLEYDAPSPAADAYAQVFSVTMDGVKELELLAFTNFGYSWA